MKYILGIILLEGEIINGSQDSVECLLLTIYLPRISKTYH